MARSRKELRRILQCISSTADGYQRGDKDVKPINACTITYMHKRGLIEPAPARSGSNKRLKRWTVTEKGICTMIGETAS